MERRLLLPVLLIFLAVRPALADFAVARHQRTGFRRDARLRRESRGCSGDPVADGRAVEVPLEQQQLVTQCFEHRFEHLLQSISQYRHSRLGRIRRKLSK